MTYTVLQPTTCTSCGDQFYAPTEWRNGHRVPVVTKCGDCANQGVLFGSES